jgi:hypothetical protein
MSSAIDRFVELIDTADFHIPFSSQWAVMIQIPPDLSRNLKQVEELEYNGKDWAINDQNIGKLLAELIQEGVYCIFADEVTLIDDSYGVADATIGEDGTTGGLIPGIYSKNRQPFSQKKLNIKFRETNLSFVDSFIRPWMILASHLGRIATSNRITKSEVTVFQYGKITTSKYEGPVGVEPSNIPVRKQFKYYGCTPTAVNGMSLTYDKTAVMSYEIGWCFDSYTVGDGTFTSTPATSFVSPPSRSTATSRGRGSSRGEGVRNERTRSASGLLPGEENPRERYRPLDDFGDFMSPRIPR